MKFKILLTITLMGLGAFLVDKLTKGKKSPVSGSVFDFKMKSLEGKEIDFSQFKGKNLLIVNTASKCGYTPQLKDLEQLHEKFGDKVGIYVLVIFFAVLCFSAAVNAQTAPLLEPPIARSLPFLDNLTGRPSVVVFVSTSGNNSSSNNLT